MSIWKSYLQLMHKKTKIHKIQLLIGSANEFFFLAYPLDYEYEYLNDYNVQ